MFVGWPMNIRRYSRHVGQPAYVRRLMCRPNEHKRVYSVPPFLSPASLSHISSTWPVPPRPRPPRPCPTRSALAAPHPGPPSALAGASPAALNPGLPRPCAAHLASASTSPVGPTPPGPAPQLGSLC
jgi:hypothetical protein